MPADNLNILICGLGGQGVEAAGQILARACFWAGCHVHAYPQSENRIQGGLNTFHLCLGHNPVHSLDKRQDIIFGFDPASVATCRPDLKEDGLCLTDDQENSAEKSTLNLPLKKLAMESAKFEKAKNIVGLGIIAHLISLPLESLERAITEKYKNKAPEVAKSNITAARTGYVHARNLTPVYELRTSGKPLMRDQRILTTGSNLSCLGAIKAGCRFVAAYPMTPSTSFLHIMASMAKDFGLSVHHVEDEIAAINMAIGAGYAGARAMTSTSGGGYALMTEAIGLAGMIETPIVIFEVQRPGPSTGLPTRTAQSDLRQVLHAGQGTFPHIVIAPGTPNQCFEMAFEAFNLADEYQCPVTVLLDKYLADQLTDTVYPQIDQLHIRRGRLHDTMTDAPFQRYGKEKQGVAIRALPGQLGGLHTANSYEHGPDNSPTEDPAEVQAMAQRRNKKIETLSQSLPKHVVEGPKDADHTVICWGSSYGPIKDAVNRLKNQYSINLLHFKHLNPLPTGTLETLVGLNHPIVIEGNQNGLLRGLLAEQCGLKAECLLDYSGRPFHADILSQRIKSLLDRYV